MESLLKSFNEGELLQSIAQTQSQLKKQPKNEGLRFLLAQFYLLNHQYEKALVHFNVLEKAAARNMERAFSIHCYQKITAALDSRSRFFHEKKMIEIDVATLSESALETLLKRLTNQQPRHSEEADRVAMPLTLTRSDGTQLSGEALDPDDLLHGYIECISQQGCYRLCAIEDLESMTFEAPLKPLDCLLQRVNIKWKQKDNIAPESETLLHINHYPFNHEEVTDLNITDWDANKIPDLVVGIGQKVICVNDDVVPVSQIRHLTFR